MIDAGAGAPEGASGARASGWVRLAAVSLLPALLAVSPASAHEYWLDPLDATPEVGGLLAANVRNGQEFVGTSLPYDPGRMSRLALVGPDGTRPIAARLGDFPAVQLVIEGPGSYLVVLDTFGKELLYEGLEPFATFLEYHAQDGVLDAHLARALPETDIRERYFRHVKLLARAGVAGDADGATGVGGAAAAVSGGAFSPVGQPLELVPLNDPYADDEIRLRLLERGSPVANAQVELFERTLAGTVSRVVVRSDGAGEVRFDVGRAGDYLLNAVRVSEPDGEAPEDGGDAPHWLSHWASLTFEKRDGAGGVSR